MLPETTTIEPNSANARAKLCKVPVAMAGASGGSHLGWGAGLGLKIVRDVVEAYQGTIAIGHPDRGFRTCIELRLPRADQVAERRSPAAD